MSVFRHRRFLYQKTEIFMKYRIERDSMGEIKVPSDKYWGAVTKAALKILKSELKKFLWK